MQEIISIGNKVDMEILVNGQVVTDSERHRILSCRVMDLPAYGLVRITMPFFEGRIVPLSVGDQYRMCFYTDKGIYASRFVVVNRLKEGNLFLADMEMQEGLKKVQRREFFRYDCRLPASYRMVSQDEIAEISETDSEDVEWKKGVILDISGGGLRMVSEFQEDTSRIIQIKFQLETNDGIRKFTEYGKLIASIRNQTNSVLYEQRIEFDHIEEQEREQIIRYIFDAERKRISKEKGLN